MSISDNAFPVPRSVESYAGLLAYIRSRRVGILAIDGPCCSGKTTLAARLAGDLDAEVYHMDDYFLRPEQRTPERRAIPGENVDHERFLEEVLLPLTRGEPPVTRRFDCKTQQLLPPVRRRSAPLAIVEGSYSLNPSLRPYYDMTLLLTVLPEVRLERLTKREPPEKLPAYFDLWIPLEDRWFSVLKAAPADLTFDTALQ